MKYEDLFGYDSDIFYYDTTTAEGVTSDSLERE